MTHTTIATETEAAYELPWRFSIRDRGEFDDFCSPIPCTKCGTDCGGNSDDSPISFAVVMFAGAGLAYEPVCKACCIAAGGEPMWDLAEALDGLEDQILKADRYWMDHVTDTAERLAAEMVATWRRIRSRI